MKKIQFNNQLITRGIFAFAAVAIVGTTTAVYGITNATANNTSGYGSTSQTAVAASNDFDASYASATATFTNAVDTCIANGQATLGGPTSQFGSQFATFSSAYSKSVSTASANFRATVVNSINTGVSKDQFIDTFNHAKNDYFNAVDAAKNTFSANVSNLGDNANQVKDAFVGCYNSSRDAYNNNVEGIKNTFANRVSNA